VQIISRIARKHLISHSKFSFISFSTILSIIGLSIGVASLIIVSSITNGFSQEVNRKLSSIDGHVRINNYYNDYIGIDEFLSLSLKLDSLSSMLSYTPYVEQNVIVKKGNLNEGVIVYGVNESSLNDIFNIYEFSINKDLFNADNSIIIGEKLALSLDVDIGQEIILFNIVDQHLLAKKFIITNLFKTEFPEYDKMLAFINVKKAQNFFNMGNNISGIIFNVKDQLKLKEIVDLIGDQIGRFPYSMMTWKDRHFNLLQWLNVYDFPIKLIIIFIMIIGFFNIAASLWMIIVEKSADYAVLNTLGLRFSMIQSIILRQGVIIGLIGSFSGAFISLLLLFIQMNFNIISLPEDIYFMDYLPVKMKLSFFILYPLIALLLSCACSYLPSLAIKRFNISEILKYE
tara:strand:+ start:1050 stop:2252 length:1203 start_codon:yes stop_codon:yes gene_type:complete